MKTIDAKQSKQCPTWKAESLKARLQACRAQLAIYGFISDRESRRLAKAIGKFDNQKGVRR